MKIKGAEKITKLLDEQLKDNEDLRREAYVLEIRAPNTIDFQDRAFRARFLERVKAEEPLPQEELGKAPVDVLLEGLADWSGSSKAQQPVLDRLVFFVDQVEKGSTDVLKEFESALYGGYYMRTVVSPQLLTELKPVLIRVPLKSWKMSKRRLMGSDPDFDWFIVEVEKGRRSLGAQAAVATRKLGKPKKADPLLDAIRSGDFDRLSKFALEDISPERFALVESEWLKAPNEVLSWMLATPKRLHEKHSKKLLEAFFMHEKEQYKHPRCKITYADWKELSPGAQFRALERNLQRDGLFTDRKPSLEEYKNLYMLWSMGAFEFEVMEYNKTKLDAGLVFATLAELTAIRDVKKLRKAVTVDDFVRVLGDVTGKELFLVVTHAREGEGSSDRLDVIMKFVKGLDGEPRKAVGDLVVRRFVEVDSQIKWFVERMLG